MIVVFNVGCKGTVPVRVKPSFSPASRAKTGARVQMNRERGGGVSKGTLVAAKMRKKLFRFYGNAFYADYIRCC